MKPDSFLRDSNRVPIENRIFYFLPSLVILGLWLVYMVYAEKWHLMLDHWPISLTMVFGSLVAGATSEGGGAIAFPVFTKLLHIQPEIARTFSLAIQTVGMGAASIVILKYRIRIISQAVIYSSLAGCFGFLAGTFLIAPLMPGAWYKIAFTILTASFGFVLFLEFRHSDSARFDQIRYGTRTAWLPLSIVGFAGGICTALVGNGIDFLTFSLLVTYYNISEKVATPTSVLLMALNALFGFAVHGFWLGTVSGVTFDYWLVCIPIVIFGAPLGALICDHISRRNLIYFLLSLILIELVSTLWIVRFDWVSRIFAPVLFFALVLLFFLLQKLGQRQQKAARSRD
ncbi:MAG: sulfite exporter TauE/SafE family protein [Leptospiraceae bacterium]|nr:sulfite exporter TauE/SafE family protein [Leptospiraceae bacterium]